MHLHSINIRNLGGFKGASLTLHPGLTLLVGRNGSGKSTLCRVFEVIMLHRLAFSQGLHNKMFDWREIVRVGAESSHLEFELSDGYHQVVLGDGGGPLIRSMVRSSEPRWFLQRVLTLSYTSRRQPLAGPAKPDPWPAAGAAVSGMKALIDWFRREENAENETRLNGNPDHRRPELQAVRQALTRFLNALGTGSFRNPRISRANAAGEPWPGEPDGILVVDKDGQQLTIRQLSDGERLMLLTVMDIARRLVLLNDTDPLQGPGLVVIDEIELHLHPGWQRRVLPALMETFPGIQFVATTHSPQVVGSVPGECIRILEDFQVYEAPPTLGRDSNSLLEDVFGVPERAPDTLQALDEVASLIDDDNLEAATSRLASLREQLTAGDPEVARLEGLLTFLAS